MAIAMASIGALILGLVVPGPHAFVLGATTFFLLPLLLRLPVGTATAMPTGTRFITTESTAGRQELFVRIAGAIAMGWATYANRQGLDGFGIAFLAGMFGLSAMLLASVRLVQRMRASTEGTRSVLLERDTLTIHGEAGMIVIAYRDIRGVEASGNQLWIVTNTGRHEIPVSKNANELLAALEAARAADAERTKSATDAPPELMRPRGMATRDWLAQLDELVATSRAAGAYRGGTRLDEDELIRIVGDDRQDAGVRVAAARVLASSNNEVRTRVSTSVQSVADDNVRVRIEAASREDVEEAAAALDTLELAELQAESD